MKAIFMMGLIVVSTLTYSAELEHKELQYPYSLATKEGKDTELVITEDPQRGVTCYMYSPKILRSNMLKKMVA